MEDNSSDFLYEEEESKGSDPDLLRILIEAEEEQENHLGVGRTQVLTNNLEVL